MEFEFGNKRKIVLVVEGNEEEIENHYEKYLKDRELSGLFLFDDEEDGLDYNQIRRMIMIAEHFTIRNYKTYVKPKRYNIITYQYIKRLFQLLKLLGEIKVDVEVRIK